MNFLVFLDALLVFYMSSVIEAASTVGANHSCPSSFFHHWFSLYFFFHCHFCASCDNNFFSSSFAYLFVCLFACLLVANNNRFASGSRTCISVFYECTNEKLSRHTRARASKIRNFSILFGAFSSVHVSWP